MKVDGRTKVLGVMGNPVEHTMSPVIHNNLAEATKDNLVYTAFHVENENVGDAVKGAYALNLLGLNVTVPHKSAVIPYLKEIDPLAKRIGAVNTLVRCDGGYKGYNTDMPGLLRAMKYDGVSIAGEEIILLGAGGVARAVAMMLADAGASHIYILNRTLDKAKNIAEEVNKYTEKPLVIPMEISAFKNIPAGKKYLAIQATSVGMSPHTEHAVIEESEFYDMIHTGYDIVFNPLDTMFMKLCRKAGADAYNGLRMLLYQGVIAYELWTGKEVTDELSENVYSKMLAAFN